MKNLNGRVAVVTGAGSGMGRAISMELADRGCDIALVDINQEGLDESASIVSDLGKQTSCHVVDVSKKKQMLALPEAVLAQHNAVHILVNNAGVAVGKPFLEPSALTIYMINVPRVKVGVNFQRIIYATDRLYR